MSDIVSEAGAAGVRSWIVELKGRRRGRKEPVSEPGFSVGTSIPAVHITKDSGLRIRHKSLSVPRIYANNLSPPVFHTLSQEAEQENWATSPHRWLVKVSVVFQIIIR